MQSLFNSAGGLPYHYLAFRYQKKYWQPFQKSVQTFLANWPNSREDVIFIGASGGYSLSEEYVNSFRRITIYDPDPAAHLIFVRRFPKAHVSWRYDDVLGLKNKSLDVFREFLKTTRPIPILFCNILGQIPILLRREDPVFVENWMKELSVILNEEVSYRPIASFHDRMSRTIRRHESEVVWRDHLTEGLFPLSGTKTEVTWRIHPKEEHVITLYKQD